MIVDRGWYGKLPAKRGKICNSVKNGPFRPKDGNQNTHNKNRCTEQQDNEAFFLHSNFPIPHLVFLTDALIPACLASVYLSLSNVRMHVK